MAFLQGKISEKNGKCQNEEKERIESRVERILFWEEQMSQTYIEQFIFPFEQSGYLTTEQKLELLLYETEKRKRGGEEICLLTMLGRENTDITEQMISELYLQWRCDGRCFFLWEEKKTILIQRIAALLRDGVAGMLFKIGGEAIEFGTYGSKGNGKENIGIWKGEVAFRFPFLKFSSEDELERVIRNLINREKHGEITVCNPLWCYVRQDGTEMYASRPPASPHWGMKIVFHK